MSDGEFELKQAPVAASNDEAILDLVDKDADQQSSIKSDAPAQTTGIGKKISTEQLDAIFPSDEILAGQGLSSKDDFTSRVVWMKQLSKKIYTDEGVGVNGKKTDLQTTRFVLFVVGEQQIAMRVGDAREIARYPNVTALPCTPDWLRGVTNLRGEIISVTDLRVLLGVDSENSSSEKIILVHCNQNQSSTAIVVDRVIGIRNAALNSIEKIDVETQGWGLFDSIAEFDGATTPILSIEVFFNKVQLQNHYEMSAKTN